MKGILSKKDAIKAAIKARISLKCMKLKPAYQSKLDGGVLIWLKQARGQNLPVGGNRIKQKALKLAAAPPHHIQDSAGRGWSGGFAILS